MGHPLPYIRYEALEATPHVMVDGAPRSRSVLTLSHWPQSPTPPEFARDVSAEIICAYLASGKDLAQTAQAVTNDHFDEDGALSIAAMADPLWALEHEALIVGAANCGDFGVVSCDEAAQVGFAITPMAVDFAGPGGGTSDRYEAVLDALPSLCERPSQFERYWGLEFEAFVIGGAALSTGEIVITERPELDLAVVERTGMRTAARLPGASGGLPLHAAVVHSATSASRILAFDEDRVELYLRYEGWVRLVTRRVTLRPDLAPLAAALTSEEPGAVIWESNPVGAIVGRLQPSTDGRSDLSQAAVTKIVVDYLATAPPAWDPFREGSAYVPPAERAAYVAGWDRAVSAGSMEGGSSARAGERERDRRRGRRRRRPPGPGPSGAGPGGMRPRR